MLRPRFTVRRLMIIVAVLAVFMTILAAIGRWLDDLSPPHDPVDWARRKAVDHAKESDAPDGFGGGGGSYHKDQAKRYADLAEGFRKAGATWEEGTIRGPFTDRLAAGQAVLIQIDAPVDAGTIPAGTGAVVIASETGDDDGCADDRPIEVRLLDGDRAGKTVLIERIYLRRKRATSTAKSPRPDGTARYPSRYATDAAAR